MRYILPGSVLLLLLLALNACKKGPDDPFLSLKSRTARLSGEWRFAKGTATIRNSSHNDQSFSFDGRGELEAHFSSQPWVTYTGKYQLSLSIFKDGTFKMTENLLNDVLEAEGTWSFNSGIGEDKKKEDVAFFITKVNRGSTFDMHFFNRTATNFFYKLTELRDDKVVMHAFGKMYSDGSDYVDFSNDYTFTKIR